jgi:hypothetical protein
MDPEMLFEMPTPLTLTVPLKLVDEVYRGFCGRDRDRAGPIEVRLDGPIAKGRVDGAGDRDFVPAGVAVKVADE